MMRFSYGANSATSFFLRKIQQLDNVPNEKFRLERILEIVKKHCYQNILLMTNLK
jgi:hypothetical protein